MPTPTVLLLAALLSGPAPVVPADTTVALGTRPTVVAFFGLPRQALLEEPMLVQVFEDFKYSLGRARPGLDSLQVDVHEIYDQTITVRAAGQERELPVGAGLPIGYYFWSPNGPAYVCRGVRVDFDIVNEAKNYLEALRTGTFDALYRCERVL